MHKKLSFVRTLCVFYLMLSLCASVVLTDSLTYDSTDNISAFADNSHSNMIIPYDFHYNSDIVIQYNVDIFERIDIAVLDYLPETVHGMIKDNDDHYIVSDKTKLFDLFAEPSFSVSKHIDVPIILSSDNSLSGHELDHAQKFVSDYTKHVTPRHVFSTGNPQLPVFGFVLPLASFVSTGNIYDVSNTIIENPTASDNVLYHLYDNDGVSLESDSDIISVFFDVNNFTQSSGYMFGFTALLFAIFVFFTMILLCDMLRLFYYNRNYVTFYALLYFITPPSLIKKPFFVPFHVMSVGMFSNNFHFDTIKKNIYISRNNTLKKSLTMFFVIILLSSSVPLFDFSNPFSVFDLSETLLSDAHATSSAAWFDTDWSYRKVITINSNQVAEPLTNYPLLVILDNDSDLTNSNTQSAGQDIRFAASDGTTLLDYEIESFSYDGTNGNLVAWVKIPSLSHTTNTVIHMYYGNTNVADAQNPSSLWSEYLAVYHLGDTDDSTGNYNATDIPGSNVGFTSGILGNAGSFGGVNDVLLLDGLNPVGNQLTMSAWAFKNSANTPTTGAIVARALNTGPNLRDPYTEWILYYVDNTRSHLRINSATIDSPVGEFPLGSFNYVVGTYDSNTGRLYSNGTEVASFSRSVSIGETSTSPTIGGVEHNFAHWRWDGLIDEVRITTTTRSTGWVQTEFNNQANPSTFYTVSPQQQTEYPALLSVGYNSMTGILFLQFDRNIDLSEINHGAIHVRGPNNLPSGSNIDLTETEFVSSSMDRSVLLYTLSSTHQTAIGTLISNGNPQLDIDAGAVSDVFGNQNEAAQDKSLSQVSDNTKPQLSTTNAITLDRQTRVLNIQFNESIFIPLVNTNLLHIRDNGMSSGGVTLSSGELITTVDGSTLSFTLTASNMYTILQMNSPELDIDGEAVYDLNANSINTITNQSIILSANDITPPEFLASTFDLNMRTLTIVFNEAINISSINHNSLHIRDATTNSGGVTLSSGELITNTNAADVLTYKFNGIRINEITSIGNPQLDIDASAVFDLNNNPINSSQDQTISFKSGGISNPIFVDETLSITDNAEAIAMIMVNETLSITDNAEAITMIMVDEELNITDQAEAITMIMVDEELNITDNAEAITMIMVDEELTITDNAEAIAMIMVDEELTITDNAEAIAMIMVDEELTITDNAEAIAMIMVDEELTITDNAEAIAMIMVDEELTITDNAEAIAMIMVNETLSITDNAEAIAMIMVNETLSITDNAEAIAMIMVNETLSITDNAEAIAMIMVNETLSITDNAEAIAMIMVNETLSITDNAEAIAMIMVDEELNITDQAEAIAMIMVDEELNITDQAEAIAMIMVDEELNITDQAEAITMIMVDEELNITDNAEAITMIMVDEELTITDNAESIAMIMVDEELTITDNAESIAMIMVNETLSITDQAESIAMIMVNETLSITDQAESIAMIMVNETLSITDQAEAIAMIMINETLSITDNAEAIAMIMINETLSITDNAEAITMIMINETLSITDNAEAIAMIMINETLSITDNAEAIAMIMINETLSITDNAEDIAMIMVDEELTITDNAEAIAMIMVDEELTITDNAEAIAMIMVDEELTITDNAEAIAMIMVDEELTITDQAEAIAMIMINETLSITDNAEAIAMIMINETLSITDNAEAITMIMINETLSITDNAEAITMIMINETLSITDNAEDIAMIMVDEELTITDNAEAITMIMVDEELTITDNAEAIAMIMVDEELTITDNAEAIAMIMVNETLSITDNAEAIAMIMVDEELTITDNAEAITMIMVDEELTITDNAEAITMIMVNETLSITDNAEDIAMIMVDEELTITDNAEAIAMIMINEELTITDNAEAIAMIMVDEELTITDNAEAIAMIMVDEELTITDNAEAIAMIMVNETLSITDQAEAIAMIMVDEELTITDNAEAIAMIMVDEELTITDNAEAIAMIMVDEELTITDNAEAIAMIMVNETLSITDQAEAIAMIMVDEELTITDNAEAIAMIIPPVTPGGSDTTPPTVRAAYLDEMRGEVFINFNERIDSTPLSDITTTGFRITDANNATGTLVPFTSSTTVSAYNTTAIVFTLTEPQRTMVVGHTTPDLDITAAAVHDVEGNNIIGDGDIPLLVRNIDTTTNPPVSLVNPTLLSARLSNNILTMVFDRPVNFNQNTFSDIRTNIPSTLHTTAVSSNSSDIVFITLNATSPAGTTGTLDIADSLVSTSDAKSIIPLDNYIVTSEDVIDLTNRNKKIAITDNYSVFRSMTYHEPLVNATIDFSNLPVRIKSNAQINSTATGIAGGTVFTTFAANSTITGPVGFTGVLNMPEDLGIECTILNPTRGVTMSCIEIGQHGNILSINPPARILLSGQAGNIPWFAQSGITTEIVNVCTSDGVAGFVANECFINVGSDLVIWTDHFTAFGSSTLNTSGNNNEEEGGGGGGCSDCTPPVLGYDSKGVQYVSDGFTYNGNSTDVQYFYTPYPLITVNVGEQNTAEFKIYENSGPQNIRQFEFGFGLEKNQYMSESKVRIEYAIDHQGNGTTTVIDPQNVLNATSLSIQTDIVPCLPESNNAECMYVKIDHTFVAPLEFNIVGTNVWDEKRNSSQNFYNHGISVKGESLNPPKEMTIVPDRLSIVHHPADTPSINLIQIDTVRNLWIDSWGYVWHGDELNMELLSEIPFVRHSDKSDPLDRMHSEFTQSMLEQQMVAQELLDFTHSFYSESLDEYADNNVVVDLELTDHLYELKAKHKELEYEYLELKSKYDAVQLLKSQYPDITFDDDSQLLSDFVIDEDHLQSLRDQIAVVDILISWQEEMIRNGS